MDAPELREWLISRVATLTGRRPGTVPADEPFASIGLDSAQLATIAGELQDLLGRRIEPSAAFEHPTIDALAREVSRPGPATAASPSAGEQATSPETETSLPVAVVGLACRMPGASDAEAYWRLMLAGRDAVREVPADRWDHDSAGAVRHGGYLDDVACFDSGFFRLPGEEADRMDPQQRLLLEVCWEALEDAGELPARLRGSRVGTFVGVSTSDYAQRQLASPATMSRHTITGCSPAVVAGRLAYLLDLRGPALSVDTACSSSLVAVHLAVRAIRSGECGEAIAAGVNVMLEPELSAGLSRAGMLAPDGCCKTFDERANGYVRGEGCGAVVLKPLPAALAAGDRVYAVIRGSAVNSDGASNGMTAPNPSAQREVLTAAYRDARVNPATLDYVECHGTGTLLGDQIETGALAAVVSPGRPAGKPCLIGSVKTNIGHLEAAAGIAGLIKACLVLKHSLVPASLHFEQPNPHIMLAERGLQVVTRAHGLGDNATRPSRVGVSSFGFSGTNAHVVLESAPRSQPSVPAGPVVFPVSARTGDGLGRQRRAMMRYLEREPGSAADMAYTACVRRTHYRPYRLAAVAGHVNELPAALADAAARTVVTAGEPRLLFVFSGQGTQWEGMGRELLDAEPVFASTIRRCDEALGARWSIESCLRGADVDVSMSDTSIAQPVTVAVQVALTRLLACYGVVPRAVVGHSVGEISAAVVAGILDLGVGMGLAACRGRAMADPDGEGSMLAVDMSRDEAARHTGSDVTLAAVNAPHNCVLSGDPEALGALRARLSDEGVFARRVAVNYAFHSTRMSGASRRLADALTAFEPLESEGTVPMYSTVSGRRVTGNELDAAYWRRGILETVQFSDAVTAANTETGGFDAVLELGGHPQLRAALREIAGGNSFAVLHTLERNANAELRMLALLAELYALGCTISWEQRYLDGGRVVSLPPYPWQRQRHWIDRPLPDNSAYTGSLLGSEMELAGTGTRVWEAELAAGPSTALNDHRVAGTVLFPAAGYAVLALLAAKRAGLAPCTVRDLKLHRPMPLDHGSIRVQTTVTPGADDLGIAVHGKIAGAREWTEYATARITAAHARQDILDLGAAQLRCLESIPTELFYRLLAASRGLEYGPAFQRLRNVWRGDGEAIGTIAAGEEGPLADAVILDAAVQLVAAAAARPDDESVASAVMVPASAGAVTAWAPLRFAVRAHAVLRSSDDSGLVADLILVDADDRVCARVDELLLRRVGPMAHHPAAHDARICRYELAWRPRPVEPRSGDHGRWLVLGHAGDVAALLTERLTSAGVHVLRQEPYGPPDDDSIRELVAARAPLDGVVCLWALDPPRQDLAWLPSMVARLVHAVSFSGQSEIPSLIIATRGAQPVDGAVPDPSAAAVWGLLRCAPIEIPALRVRCVDLDPNGSAGDVAASLCDEMTTPTGLTADTLVGYRDGARFVQRIVAAAPLADQGALRLQHHAAYVITGGTGRLGLRAARLLLERGAGMVALLSRSADDTGRRAEPIVQIRVDVSDMNALAAALQRLRALGRPIRGIVHAAGIIGDGPLLELSSARIRSVMAGKAAGAAHLHELTKDDPLDWFVLYSSAASVLGSPGQANYAAANAYLDALAHHRRMHGRPAVSINWGPWAKAGMAVDAGLAAQSRTPPGSQGEQLRTGTSALDPADGLVQLEQLMLDGAAQTVVLPFDLQHLLQFYPVSAGETFFDEIAAEDIQMLKSIGTPFIARASLATPYIAPRNDVERRIAAIWQSSLGMESIGVHDSLFELGGDSVFANKILVEINRMLGVSIDPQKAFEDFSVAHVAELAEAHILERLEQLTEEEAARLLESADDGQVEP